MPNKLFLEGNNEEDCDIITETYSNHMDAWLDWADPNVAVAKQQGDKIILNVYSEQDTSARISYNTAAFNGECPNGNFNVNEGLNTCKLEVKDEAPLGIQKINVGSKALDVKITDSSDLLIITDSEKLFERFPAESNGVKAVLRQAYSNAEGKGIVYDLSQYNIGATNPFQKMINYVEKIFKPKNTDNTYSNKVSEFVKQKCNTCKDVMLIGDDFVVPHYRRDISNYEGYLWEKQLASSSTYTDQHLIKKSYKPLSEIEDLFTKEQDVKIIIDDNLKSQLHGKVEELKTLIESKYLSAVEYIDPAAIGCNSFSELDESTLIIIGGEENNAVRCHPFIPKEDSYLSVERNVWDIGHYSILLNPTSEKYDNILALYNIIQNGPDVDWDSDNYVIACLWSGKFGGSVPTAKEITCNMIPLVELAPDARDSWKCLFANKDKDTDDGVVNYFVCGVVHFATGYDMATWGAAIFTFGATGAGGEVFDGGIATLKVFLKNTLPNIVKGVGRKVVKDAAETIVAAPKLLKSLGELVWRFPSKIPDMIEGSIQILKHGPEVAESAFDTVKGWNFDFSMDSLKGVGNVEDLKFNKQYAIVIDGDFTEAGYRFFGDDEVYENIIIARKGFEEEFKKIKVKIGSMPSSNSNDFGLYDPINEEIILNVNRISDSTDRLKKVTIIHEHAHALRDIALGEKNIDKLKRLGLERKKVEEFIEFDDQYRMYNILESTDNIKSIEFKNNIRTYEYGQGFLEIVESDLSAGYAKADKTARKLAETEKFGFNEEHQKILELVQKDSLKEYILNLANKMVLEAGHVINPSKYDNALIEISNLNYLK